MSNAPHEHKLPVNANPRFYLKTINPYNKFTSGKGMSSQEHVEFCGVCMLGETQLIRCYRNLDSEISRCQFSEMCAMCPYSTRPGGSRRFDCNKYPYFILAMDDVFDPVRDIKPQSYVYLISDGEFVKIGHAANPHKRLRDLQVANARELTLLCLIGANSKKGAEKIEAALHFEYGAFRKRGEWFNILSYINVPAFIEQFGYDDAGDLE